MTATLWFLTVGCGSSVLHPDFPGHPAGRAADTVEPDPVAGLEEADALARLARSPRLDIGRAAGPAESYNLLRELLAARLAAVRRAEARFRSDGPRCADPSSAPLRIGDMYDALAADLEEQASRWPGEAPTRWLYCTAVRHYEVAVSAEVENLVAADRLRAYGEPFVEGCHASPGRAPEGIDRLVRRSE